MSDGMPYTNLLVLEQDAVGFSSDSPGAGEGHDVAFGHHGATHVGVEFAVIMDDGVELFFVSGFKGCFVLLKDAHGTRSSVQHITTSTVVDGAGCGAVTFEVQWTKRPP